MSRIRFKFSHAIVLTSVLVLLVAGLLTASPVYAASYIVNTTDDNNDGTCDVTHCSLREAINAANASAADDDITFSVNGTFAPTNTLPDLANNGTLTITGNGAANTVISGSDARRVFLLSTGANVTLDNLTVTDGKSTGYGGGINVDNGTLTITNSTISSNTGFVSGGVHAGNAAAVSITNSTISDNTALSGAGMSSYGALTITSSTFSGNTATTNVGGGVYSQGSSLTVTSSTFSGNTARGGTGIYISDTPATIINSLFTGNTATMFDGGGIFLASGTTTIVNSTFSGNSANVSGGNIAIAAAPGTTLNFYNSIAANAGSGADCDTSGGTFNAQNSLIEDGTCGVTSGVNGNLTVDPELNGDFTLQSTSDAIDAGDNSLISGYSTDLAGNTRIQNSTVDMGAYESALFVPEVNVTLDFGSADEGSSSNFTFTRSGAAANWTNPLTVNVLLTQAFGMVNDDYTLSGASITGESGYQTVTIPAGQGSVVMTFAATDDVDAEAGNLVLVEIDTSPNYTIGANSGQQVNIPQNDFVVTNTNDSGDGSLRQAITNVNDFNTNDTITFTVNGTFAPTSTLPDLANNGTLTINGNGAANTIISGSDARRVFLLSTGANVTLDSLTVTDGNDGGFGGGINVDNGMLTITNSTVSSSTAGTGGGIIGGGASTINITNSTISGNNATDDGGGIGSFGTVTLTNSTISGNGATDAGGGISSSGSLTVIGGSITGNTATNLGGGIAFDGSSLLVQSGARIEGNTAGAGGGIYHLGGNVTITDSYIQDNTATSNSGGAIRFADSGTRSVTNTCIVLNSDVAVTFDGGTGLVDATNNWWGSSSGPFTGLNSPAPNDANTEYSTGDQAQQSFDPNIFDYSGYQTTAPSGCNACAVPSGVGGGDRNNRMCPLVP